MQPNWIIIHSNSENAAIDFYLYKGTVYEMKKRLLMLVQNSDFVNTAELNEDDYPDSIEKIEYDPDTNTYRIMISDKYEETDEVYTAKEVTSIERL